MVSMEFMNKNAAKISIRAAGCCPLVASFKTWAMAIVRYSSIIENTKHCNAHMMCGLVSSCSYILSEFVAKVIVIS